MDAVGRSFAKLAKKTHNAHHVNLYSLENYRASLICSVSELTISLFSLEYEYIIGVNTISLS